jgi:hypothetical protein
MHNLFLKGEAKPLIQGGQFLSANLDIGTTT